MSVLKPTPTKVFPKQLLITSMVKDSLQKAKNHLDKFDDVIKAITVVTTTNWGNWGMKHINDVYEAEVIPFVKNIRESFKLFERGLYKEVNEMKAIFKQMENEVDQCSVEKVSNEHFASIMGYGGLQIENILILRVYYIEGLGHNLFSAGQFCDSNLEVAFRKHTCFVRNLEGVDLLSGSRGSNLYTISFDEMMKSSRICLLSKASKIKSWLWHHHLSHLNFSTINQLAKEGLVKGLPKLKYIGYNLHFCWS
ncbi:retrovirus-related pol polyprotein from transposon TNT 1-94 [Tanacetum coccineum]